VNARFQRCVLGAASLAAVVLFVTRTAPHLQAARGSLESAERALDASAERVDRALADPLAGAALDLDALAEARREAALFFEVPTDPSGVDLAASREAAIAALAERHEIPERLLRHLFPVEAFDEGGRRPTPEEKTDAARRLRIAETAVDTLLRHRISEIDFLVFREASPGEGVALVLRYRGAAEDHARAYAALVGRRTEPPFFLPDQLALAPDPAGAREGDLVVRIALRVPTPGEGGRR